VKASSCSRPTTEMTACRQGARHSLSKAKGGSFVGLPQFFPIRGHSTLRAKCLYASRYSALRRIRLNARYSSFWPRAPRSERPESDAPISFYDCSNNSPMLSGAAFRSCASMLFNFHGITKFTNRRISSPWGGYGRPKVKED
jgi:hypothetical protein